MACREPIAWSVWMAWTYWQQVRFKPRGGPSYSIEYPIPAGSKPVQNQWEKNWKWYQFKLTWQIRIYFGVWLKIRTKAALKLTARCSTSITTLQPRKRVNKQQEIDQRNWFKSEPHNLLQVATIGVRTMCEPKLWPIQFNDRKSNFNAFSIRCNW